MAGPLTTAQDERAESWTIAMIYLQLCMLDALAENYACVNTCMLFGATGLSCVYATSQGALPETLNPSSLLSPQPLLSAGMAGLLATAQDERAEPWTITMIYLQLCMLFPCRN